MKKLLSVFAALAVAVSLSGCQAGQTDTVISETTQIEVITQTEKDYSDYEEFPEGWSAERVLNMISIDGHQLSFPCTVDDILALSEDFEVDEHKINDMEKGAFLYYKDIEIGGLAYNNDNIVYYATFSDFSQHGYVYLEGINIQNNSEISSLFQTLTDNQLDSQFKRYIDNKLLLNFFYSESNNSITLSWEEIK